MVPDKYIQSNDGNQISSYNENVIEIVKYLNIEGMFEVRNGQTYKVYNSINVD